MTASGKKPLGAAFWKELMGETERPAISEEMRPLLACPDDDASLEFREDEKHFRCPACQRVYTQEAAGALPLLPSDDPYKLTPAEVSALDGVAPSRNRFVDDPPTAFPAVWSELDRLVPDWSGKVAVDVCAGTGWLGLELARRGATVALLDIVAGNGGLGTAAEKASAASLRVDLLQGDACRLPLAAESMDVVTISAGIAWQRRPERLMKEIGRILKPDGLLLNIGEPVRATAEGVPGDRVLSVADYRAIYGEGLLDMECIVPGGERTEGGGILSRLGSRWRENRASGDLLFVGRRRPDFDISRVRLPWRSGGENDAQ